MLRVITALVGLTVIGLVGCRAHVGGAIGQTLYLEQPHRRYVPPVVYCDRECQWRANNHRHWRREQEHYYDRRDWR